LDLVSTKSEQTVDSLLTDTPDALSNHSLVRWSLPLQHEPSITTAQLEKLGAGESLIKTSLELHFCHPVYVIQHVNLVQLTNCLLCTTTSYTRCLISSRQHRRLHLVASGLPPEWTLFECRQLRRNSRRLERKYRCTNSAADRLARVEHERSHHKVYRQKERSFWNVQLIADPRNLWNTLQSVLSSSV